MYWNSEDLYLDVESIRVPVVISSKSIIYNTTAVYCWPIYYEITYCNSQNTKNIVGMWKGVISQTLKTIAYLYDIIYEPHHTVNAFRHLLSLDVGSSMAQSWSSVYFNAFLGVLRRQQARSSRFLVVASSALGRDTDIASACITWHKQTDLITPKQSNRNQA